ncbi:MAG: hypothetical protein ACTH30_06350 [Leucobacter sp.]
MTDTAVEIERKYLLEKVFRLSGVPEVNFVRPVEFDRLVVALRTPGRGVVIEGPSKIGKTSAVMKALEEIEGNSGVVKLSARKPADRELIDALPGMEAIGTVIIDDFHRLEQRSRSAISDFLKLLADEGRTDSKVVVVGINKVGESLIALAPDLGGRIDVIKLGANPIDRVRQLIDDGCEAMNISFVAREEIAENAQGSFNIAQALCHDACLTASVIEGQSEYRSIDASFELIKERVLDRLSILFQRNVELFSRGKRLRREGRAPYLQILRWLSQSPEWTVDLNAEMSKHPTLRASVSQIVEKGHLEKHLADNADELSKLLHYDAESKILAAEDPQFYFYIHHLAWNRFAERLGFYEVSFESTYDYALSFAGADRDVADLLHEKLTEYELGVFYDLNEQSRILAQNVEEYLAPIYKSEATYVVVLLGEAYPDRIWTRFESKQFRARFGDRSVVPIWFAGSAHSVFDESREYGGMTIDRSAAIEPQVDAIAKTLTAKLTLVRTDAANQARDELEASLDDRN